MTGASPDQRWPADFRDLLVAFCDGGAEFMLIGGHAVAHHGHVRATLDLDVLVRPSRANAAREATSHDILRGSVEFPSPPPSARISRNVFPAHPYTGKANGKGVFKMVREP